MRMIFILIVLVPGVALSQEWDVHVVDVSPWYFPVIHVGDVDSDGDEDILATSDNLFGGYWLWQENVDGTGLTWACHSVENLVNPNAICDADIDNDGDSDVICANSRLISWWENEDAIGLNWAEHIVYEMGTQVQDVCPADIDEDGDLDIIGTDVCCYWWENLDGIGLNWIQHEVDFTCYSVQKVIAVDMDNDSDMDILANWSTYRDRPSAIGGIVWWENHDSGINWTRHTVNNYISADIDCCDFDGDADIDVLCYSINSHTVLSSVSWWENVDSLGQYWSEFVIEYLPADDNVFIESADLDEDGDCDVIRTRIHSWSECIVWHENLLGNGTDWTVHMINDDYMFSSEAIVSDVDGDDDLDLVSIYRIPVLGDFILWFENPQYTDVDESLQPTLPGEFAFLDPYPNPFNNSTVVIIALPAPSELRLTAFNLTGQRIAVLAQGMYSAGTHRFTFDASSLAAGVYFVHATVPGQMDQVQKVMLVR